VQEGSIVEVNYTGKVVASNEVFDTTVEKKAVDAGIFSKNAKYQPVTVIVGENELLKGLDDELKGMKIGETKNVALNPTEAFGERNPKLVRVLPLREFQKQKMNPVPGLIIEVDGRQGRIQTVSGGRVRIDFNHPLAGKDVEYELELKGEVKGAKDQVNALFDKYFGMLPETEKKMKIDGKTVEIALDAKHTAEIAPLKKRFSDLVTKNVKGIETVRFVEEFREEKKAKKEAKAEKKEAKAEKKEAETEKKSK